MVRNDFYVYVLFRPNGVPCYVGKGRGNRISCHWKYARGRYARNPHLVNIIQNAGGQLPAVKIRENLVEETAFFLETLFIRAIGREIDGGPLVNMTDGGEGQSGRVVSDETKKKLRDGRARLSPEWQRKNNEARARSMRDPVVREKIGAAFRGKKLTDEHRAKIAAAGVGRKLSQHQKDCLLAATRRPKTPEARANMSASRKSWYAANPGQKRGPRSPETKAKLSAATKAYFARKREQHAE